MQSGCACLQVDAASPSGGAEAAAAKPDAGGKSRLNAAGLDENGNEVAEWDYLNNFFKRFNKASNVKDARALP